MSVAVVLPGGGARGAYEVGALSVLLPALEARGERIDIWCGTSVGAINAAACGSLAHRPAAVQTAEIVGLWEGLRKEAVLSPIVGSGGLRVGLRLVAQAVGWPGTSVASLLDPSPLAASLDRWINWRQLERNVRRGNTKAVCVVATEVATGKPTGFVSTAGAVPQRRDNAIRYVRTRLNGEHVRASAAIPVLFPTVEVRTPAAAAGHYSDGGTRLNSPIKPAIDLGADKVIVIGLEPFAGAPRPHAASRRTPSLADVAANLLDGLLVDQVAQDLRRLAAINSFFAEEISTGPMASSHAYRVARGHQPYRPIAYALVSPRQRGVIGRLAEEVFAKRYGGLRGIREVDFMLMARLLGSATRSRGEFLSFLLFDPAFVEPLIEMGRRDARRWLARHPRIWCRDAAHDLSFGALDRVRMEEQQAIDEFRFRRTR